MPIHKNSIKIGAGYNPALLSNALTLHKNAQLLEFGLSEYDQIVALYKQTINLSLHIARSPISEKKELQNKYIKNLYEKIKDDNLFSIGFHLSGERNSGIGRYGFSSHYNDSPSIRENAIRFIKYSQDILQIPIWIENANFYSSSFDDIKRNYYAISDIISKTNAKLIIDLTHLYIDVRNANGNILDIISQVSWQDVAEIHLSGMLVGKSGVLHDGHNQPISDEIWSLFNTIHENCLNGLGLYVTIEHTDKEWCNYSDKYYQDFTQLTCILNKKNEFVEINVSEQADNYARNYLRQIIEKRFDALKNFIDINRETGCFNSLVEKWINLIIYKTDGYLVLNKDEMLDEDPKAIVLQEHFKNYAREALK